MDWAGGILGNLVECAGAWAVVAKLELGAWLLFLGNPENGISPHANLHPQGFPEFDSGWTPTAGAWGWGDGGGVEAGLTNFGKPCGVRWAGLELDFGIWEALRRALGR